MPDAAAGLDAAAGAARVRSCGMSTALAYLELCKPRLSALAVFAVVAGCFMGWTPYGMPPIGVVAATTIGTFLVAAASSSFNMYRERELDARMHRTQARPLPSGRLSPPQVLRFGIVTAALGEGTLLLLSRPLA